jgi:prepilin-type N-terminal cleavage/methylation domain-containing protein
MKSHHSNDAGFSLIELMIASVVLTIGLISVVGVAAYVSRTNSTSNTLNVLVSAAQDEADKLRNLTWSLVTEDPKLTVGGSLDYSSSDSNHRETIDNTPAGTLLVTWRVSNGPGTTGDLRTLTIRVTQQGAPARLADGITITMYITKT